MEALGKSCAFLLAAIPLGIYRGWALSLMWFWFVVPFGIPAIGIAWAIGLGYLVSMMTYELNGPTRETADVLVMSFIMTSLWLLFAFICHLFM